jgi:REP element-mobilizing transposase RayT
VDRFWLLTWTTYGTWLPGDERGFVSEVNDGYGGRVIHNLPGTPYDCDWDRLRFDALNRLRGSPVYLDQEQATRVVEQFEETASYRGWLIAAAAVMANHVHVVVGVPGDPQPEHILRDLKSYASRALNRQFGRPASETWWTESGSKRKLKDEAAILGAVAYVRDQEVPLVVSIRPEFAAELGSGTAPGKSRKTST